MLLCFSRRLSRISSKKPKNRCSLAHPSFSVLTTALARQSPSRRIGFRFGLRINPNYIENPRIRIIARQTRNPEMRKVFRQDLEEIASALKAKRFKTHLCRETYEGLKDDQDADFELTLESI